MDIALKYELPGHTVLYELRRMENAELQGGKTENATNQFFSLTYEGEREGLEYFTYTVSKFSQTNHKGLYSWTEDLQPLVNNLEIGVKDGRIKKIFNREKILILWLDKVWYNTRKKHKGEENAKSMLENIDQSLRDDEIFANIFRYAPPFSLLFSGLTGVVFDQEKIDKRKSRLPGFFGETYIPLLIEDEIQASQKQGESYEIQSEGKLDEKNFDRNIFRSFVKTLSDSPTAVCDILTRHTERYLLDTNGWIKTGMLLHLSAVPYFMLREERCFLKMIES